MKCQIENCSAQIAFSICWQSPSMRAPAFWYQCERCMEESVAALTARDPAMEVRLRRLEPQQLAVKRQRRPLLKWRRKQ